jgi:cobalt-zinc-cadmium efflux system outer membrane protein
MIPGAGRPSRSPWPLHVMSVIGLGLAVAGVGAQSPGADTVPPMALRPVTRAKAIDLALSQGPHVALARSDSLLARATLTAASELPNPTATLTYTRDEPHYHGIVNVPFDYPWVRRARVRAADAGLRSAKYRYAFERASVRFEVDTMYTRAVAASARRRVSHSNAVDADSLERLARVRRDAGDASDMDVELAAVNAGQQVNVAASDSLAEIGAVLDLQSVLGLPADRPVIALVDTLSVPDPSDSLLSNAAASAPRSMGPSAVAAAPAAPTPAAVTAPGSSTVPLQVAAAQATLESEESTLSLAQRSVLAQPTFQAGLEGGDPTQRFLLPTFGFSIPFPLFNRSGGEIAVARASRDRAATELDVAQRQSAADAAQSRRELAVALSRANRDRELLTLANHVVARSLTAFAEGATALPSVLEAQRSARDALSQYVDDLAAANVAAAAVRLFTLTTASR